MKITTRLSTDGMNKIGRVNKVDIESERNNLINEAKEDPSWQGPPYLGRFAYLGRFESELAEAGWIWAIDSSSDEDCGDSDWGHYDLFAAAGLIIESTSHGFVYSLTYGSPEDARAAYAAIESEWNSIDNEESDNAE